MSIMKWNPRNRQMSIMHETLDDMFRDFFGDRWSPGTTVAADWIPPTDVTEDEARYVVTVDLPGMNREDIKISVENGNLTIRGERKHEHETKEKGYSRFERAYGSFTRTFALPTTIDGKKIEANYKDGVLTVILPKSEESRPKSIEVRVN
jgi:HSP20 family protein